MHGCRKSKKPRDHKQLEQQTQHHQCASYLHVSEYCCKPSQKGNLQRCCVKCITSLFWQQCCTINVATFTVSVAGTKQTCSHWGAGVLENVSEEGRQLSDSGLSRIVGHQPGRQQTCGVRPGHDPLCLQPSPQLRGRHQGTHHKRSHDSQIYTPIRARLLFYKSTVTGQIKASLWLPFPKSHK